MGSAGWDAIEGMPPAPGEWAVGRAMAVWLALLGIETSLGGPPSLVAVGADEAAGADEGGYIIAGAG